MILAQRIHVEKPRIDVGYRWNYVPVFSLGTANFCGCACETVSIRAAFLLKCKCKQMNVFGKTCLFALWFDCGILLSSGVLTAPYHSRCRAMKTNACLPRILCA